jgi:single-strand DNA-binding protein
MSANNCWTGMGRLGRDAETRWTANEKQITNFSIAVDVGWGQKKKPMWINVGAWGSWIDNVMPYLKKGTQVVLSGEIELREYEKDGIKKQSLQLTIGPGGLWLTSKGSNDGHQSQPQSGARGFRDKPADKQEDAFADDDIPF